jgi:hypothetical protein
MFKSRFLLAEGPRLFHNASLLPHRGTYDLITSALLCNSAGFGFKEQAAEQLYATRWVYVNRFHPCRR